MSFRRLLINSLLCISFGFFLPEIIYAASLTTTLNTNSLQIEQELTAQVALNINTADGTVYYLRGVFAKSDTTNYCGYTWNGNNWYSGPYSSGSNGWKNFLPITIQNNAWTGELKVKIDIEDNGCKDSGSYLFKIQRFTESGSGSFDTQSEQLLSLVIPSATPTAAPTLTPTKIPTPTSAPKVPTPTKTSATQAIQHTPTRASVSSSQNASEGAVLGDTIASSEGSQDGDLLVTDSPSPTVIPVKVAGSTFTPAIFVLVGASFLISCGILLFLKLKREGKV